MVGRALAAVVTSWLALAAAHADQPARAPIVVAPAPPSAADERDARQLHDAEELIAHERTGEAEVLLVDLFTRNPRGLAASNAAMLLLETLHRQGRLDELGRWVRQLRGRGELLAAQPELATMLDAVHVRVLQREAERLQQAAADTDDLVGFERCGEVYLEAHAAAATEPFDDELLYNAGFCLGRARSIAAALRIFGELIDRHPRSALVPPALAMTGRLHAATTDFAAAADAYEQLARRYPAEDSALDALHDAFRYRVALGDLDAAGRDVDLMLKTWAGKEPTVAWAAPLAMAHALLDRDGRGDRARARRWLTRALRAEPRGRPDDPWSLITAARLLWDAACPERPRDGLCTDAAGMVRRRDRALAGAAQGLAERLVDDREPPVAEAAQLLTVEARFERLHPRGAVASSAANPQDREVLPPARPPTIAPDLAPAATALPLPATTRP